MQSNSASVNVDISCLGYGDMLRENWTARNLRPLIGQFTLYTFNVNMYGMDQLSYMSLSISGL